MKRHRSTPAMTVTMSSRSYIDKSQGVISRDVREAITRLAAESKESRLASEAAAEKNRLASEAASEKNRLAFEVYSKEYRLASEAASEKNRLASEAASEKNRMASEAASEKNRAEFKEAIAKPHWQTIFVLCSLMSSCSVILSFDVSTVFKRMMGQHASTTDSLPVPPQPAAKVPETP